MKFQWLMCLVCFGFLSTGNSFTGGLQGSDTESDLVSSGTPPAPGTFDVGGTAYAINLGGGYIVVQTNKGCYQAIYLDSNSSVIKNGVAATILDITSGNRIRSSNSLSTGFALTIDVRS